MTKTNRLARKCVHFKLEALVKRLHEGDNSGDYSRAQLAAKDLLKRWHFLWSTPLPEKEVMTYSRAYFKDQGRLGSLKSASTAGEI